MTWPQHLLLSSTFLLLIGTVLCRALVKELRICLSHASGANDPKRVGWKNWFLMIRKWNISPCFTHIICILQDFTRMQCILQVQISWEEVHVRSISFKQTASINSFSTLKVSPCTSGNMDSWTIEDVANEQHRFRMSIMSRILHQVACQTIGTRTALFQCCLEFLYRAPMMIGKSSC